MNPDDFSIPYKVPQDLHMHSTFSSLDNSVVPEQTIQLISEVGHARVMGISDHLDCLAKDDSFEEYIQTVRSYDLRLGVEVDGSSWIKTALEMDVDYYVYHCRNTNADFKGVTTLLATGKPVIIAHPNYFETNLLKIPVQCYIEINNRYIWRGNWKEYFSRFPLVDYKYVISSDAHQPSWLNQNAARFASRQLGITESLLFSKKKSCDYGEDPRLVPAV